MEKTARLFNCARCHRQVIICSDCDRGNIYCGLQCSQPARKGSVIAAGRRYQTSFRGRLKHAERQRRYQERQKEKMTHQGSSDLPDRDLLPPETTEMDKHPASSASDGIRCHFCRKVCSKLLRVRFLRNEPQQKEHMLPRWPLGP